MSDFFEFPEPPAEPRSPQPELPPWVSRPRGWLPGVAPLELVLARSARAVAALSGVSAYPGGFAFELLVLADDPDQELDPMLMGRMHHPGMPRGHAREAMMRFGLEFSDGARVTNLDVPPPFDRETPPATPVLRSGGGGAGGGEWHQDMWVWPLPPPGPLAFVCDWPAAGIALTRVEIDAQLLIDAAGRAREIFALPGSSGGNSVSIRSLGGEA